MSNRKDKKIKELKCNICGLPDIVEYTEFDEETRRTKTHKHKVSCLGHEHLHGSLWNMRQNYYAEPEISGIKQVSYDDYRKFYARMKRKQEKSNE